MNDLVQQLLGSLAGGAMSQIGEKIGADESATGAAVPAAMSVLMSALARNASKSDGAEALHQALAEDHDGSILKDLGGFLSDPAAANGAGILGHVLGGSEPAVARGLAKGSGLDAAQVTQLLEVVAPLVMGALGAQQRQEGLDAQGLSALLGKQSALQAQGQPDLMGTLNTLLDADKDGSAMDDVVSFMGKLFGKK